MNIFTLYLLIALIVLIVVFLPDMFSYCMCCGRLKPVFLFKLRTTRIKLLGRSKRKSVCRKCCLKYGIESLRDVERLESLRRKVKAELYKGYK